MSIKNRIFTYDFLRAICVVWIVCIWHFTNYAIDTKLGYMIYNSFACAYFTKIVLALFMFLSGLFSSKLKVTSLVDAKDYFIHKFFRFYILYFCAVVTILFADYPPYITFFAGGGGRQILLSLLGVATIFNMAPSTLWFIDLLLFFIYLTPIFQSLTFKYKIVLLCGIWVILFLINRYTAFVDGRAVLYSPFYFAGLLFEPYSLLDKIRKYKQVVLTITVLIVLFSLETWWFQYIEIASYIIIFLYLATIIQRNILKFNTITGSINLLSYLSLSAYLFHRQLFKLYLTCGGIRTFAPVVVFFISYAIQKTYDTYSKKLINKYL